MGYICCEKGITPGIIIPIPCIFGGFGGGILRDYYMKRAALP
jgi:hypothetical protein